MLTAHPMIKTPGRSAFAGLREVAPGTTVVLSANGETIHRYWTLTPAEHRDDPPTTVERVRGLLGRAVRGQLAADVPVCMLLSGGLDSSALAALGRPPTGNLHTLSVDVGARAADDDAMGRNPDGPYVDLMVRHLDTTHRTVRPSADDLADPGASPHWAVPGGSTPLAGARGVRLWVRPARTRRAAQGALAPVSRLPSGPRARR
ncbi:asparagine synthase-related protein [Streptomyces sp. NPDC046385]|uniref:asparagine synthase-related protein n=1 Tax=Streptomyces sp. NPDC046385 TaxID=3154918 RepID=UPI0033C37E64